MKAELGDAGLKLCLMRLRRVRWAVSRVPCNDSTICRGSMPYAGRHCGSGNGRQSAVGRRGEGRGWELESGDALPPRGGPHPTRGPVTIQPYAGVQCHALGGAVVRETADNGRWGGGGGEGRGGGGNWRAGTLSLQGEVRTQPGGPCNDSTICRGSMPCAGRRCGSGNGRQSAVGRRGQRTWGELESEDALPPRGRPHPTRRADWRAGTLSLPGGLRHQRGGGELESGDALPPRGQRA